MVRLLFLHIILWLSAGLAFGQNPFVELEVNPKTIERGQSISITIKSNVDGRVDMNLPDEFIQSGAVQNGMSSSIVLIDGKQRNVRYNYQSFTGYFEADGDYIIGPVLIETKNGTIESESHKVKVIKRQNMISEDPSKNMNQIIFGIIEQSKKELYEGEPLLLEGKVYSQVEVLQVEGFNSFNFDGPSDNHHLTNPNQVSSSYAVINGKNIQTFRIGKTVLFPEKIGNYDINPFQTIILYNDPRSQYPSRAKIVSNETKVKIKPLPSGTPKFFIGAVGNFSVSASLSNSNLEQGKVVELRVKVSGHGNLHNIEKPKIYLPNGLSFYGDPEVTDSVNFSARGSEGSKSFTYFIQVNTSGNIQINPIKIAYFNPMTEKYETSQCKIGMLKVKSNGEEIQEIPVVKKPEVRTPTMQPYITERIGIDHSSNPLFRGWQGAALFFSPIMLGFVLGFAVRIKKQNQVKATDKKMQVQHRIVALAGINKLREENANIDKLEELSRILIDFLASEFKVAKGEISRSFLKSKSANEISEQDYEKLIYIFKEIDSMKYGGSILSSDVSHLKDEVERIIKTFEE
ncbi:BatD family protein [Brumimicrobium mesophilum]|uniref:BatD family protein n=1 Tax=Brumimicrobium mesophilum TaxID=392717 RepID=UPI000D142C9A|nr:BatD family protein [Brumimicrobium mesophilum]